jgi:hypothetical protein
MDNFPPFKLFSRYNDSIPTVYDNSCKEEINMNPGSIYNTKVSGF